MKARSFETVRRSGAACAAAAALLALAGCGGDLNPFSRDIVDVACPPMGSLKQADALTRFRPGDGRDLTDVLFQAEVGRVVGKCEVSQSKLVADVKAGVEILAERGPALEGETAPIEYFVAVQSPDGEIVAREGFVLDLSFEDGLRESRAVDFVTFKLPNATPEALRSYRIFVGLQMTETEWAFSQRARRQAR